MFISTSLDPPTEFDRSFLGEPNITYEPLDPGSASVALRCEVLLINQNMQSWTNVSYIITWYSEGSHLYTDNICGDLAPGTSQYDRPCPGKPLFSRLEGGMYSVNRLVSHCVLFFFFGFFFTLSNTSTLIKAGKITVNLKQWITCLLEVLLIAFRGIEQHIVKPV